MPPSAAVAPALDRRALTSGGARLRVVDVAVWYGARSGGVRTYLDAKARAAADGGVFEHHLIVPGAAERHENGHHELPGVLVVAANGYRLPATVAPLLRTLTTLAPDVVVLHDVNWWPVTVADHARRLGAKVVAVHHGSAESGAIGKPGPRAAWRAGLSAAQQRLYRRADAVMAFAAPREAAGTPHIPMRYGVDAAFRPRYVPSRGNHVLYAGRLAPEKGVDVLLDAMRHVDPGRELRLLGRGPSERALRGRARRLGLTGRVTFGPFIADPAALARAYTHAACVVVPGRHETFGLVALEAAASGAAVVATSGVPAARHTDGLARIVPGGDARALADAIGAAADAVPDLLAAARLGARRSWRAAFEAEARELRSLVA